MPGSNITQTTPKRGAAPREGDGRTRIAPKIREAIRLRIEKGFGIEDACREAGCPISTYYKAAKRPTVAKLIAETKAKVIQQVDSELPYLRARAIAEVAKMLEQDEDKAAKWKAVEFFTRQAKKSQPVQQVNVNLGPAGAAYAYPQQGRNVIDVTPNDGQQTGSQTHDDDNAS